MYEYKSSDNWKENFYNVSDLLINILDNNNFNDVDLHVLLELQSFFANYAQISSHSELKKLLESLSSKFQYLSSNI